MKYDLVCNLLQDRIPFLRFQYMLELANTYPKLSKCGQGSQIETTLTPLFWAVRLSFLDFSVRPVGLKLREGGDIFSSQSSSLCRCPLDTVHFSAVDLVMFL